MAATGVRSVTAIRTVEGQKSDTLAVFTHGSDSTRAAITWAERSTSGGAPSRPATRTTVAYGAWGWPLISTCRAPRSEEWTRARAPPPAASAVRPASSHRRRRRPFSRATRTRRSWIRGSVTCSTLADRALRKGDPSRLEPARGCRAVRAREARAAVSARGAVPRLGLAVEHDARARRRRRGGRGGERARRRGAGGGRRRARRGAAGLADGEEAGDHLPVVGLGWQEDVGAVGRDVGDRRQHLAVDRARGGVAELEGEVDEERVRHGGVDGEVPHDGAEQGGHRAEVGELGADPVREGVEEDVLAPDPAPVAPPVRGPDPVSPVVQVAAPDIGEGVPAHDELAAGSLHREAGVGVLHGVGRSE